MSKIPLQAIPGSEAPGTISTTQLDAFDPANLRLSQSFTETVDVKKRGSTTCRSDGTHAIATILSVAWSVFNHGHSGPPELR